MADSGCPICDRRWPPRTVRTRASCENATKPPAPGTASRDFAAREPVTPCHAACGCGRSDVRVRRARAPKSSTCRRLPGKPEISSRARLARGIRHRRPRRRASSASPTVSSLVVETFVDAPVEATLTSRPAVTTSSGASMSTVSAVIRLGSAYRCSTASSLRASAEPKWKVSNNAMKHRTIFSASPEQSHRHPHYRAYRRVLALRAGPASVTARDRL